MLCKLWVLAQDTYSRLQVDWQLGELRLKCLVYSQLQKCCNSASQEPKTTVYFSYTFKFWHALIICSCMYFITNGHALCI